MKVAIIYLAVLLLLATIIYGVMNMKPKAKKLKVVPPSQKLAGYLVTDDVPLQHLLATQAKAGYPNLMYPVMQDGTILGIPSIKFDFEMSNLNYMGYNYNYISYQKPGEKAEIRTLEARRVFLKQGYFKFIRPDGQIYEGTLFIDIGPAVNARYFLYADFGDGYFPLYTLWRLNYNNYLYLPGKSQRGVMPKAIPRTSVNNDMLLNGTFIISLYQNV